MIVSMNVSSMYIGMFIPVCIFQYVYWYVLDMKAVNGISTFEVPNLSVFKSTFVHFNTLIVVLRKIE